MDKIRKNNIENARLSEDQLEMVSGGARNSSQADKNGASVKIRVACQGGCGRAFEITKDTTVHICACGYKNEFYG